LTFPNYALIYKLDESVALRKETLSRLNSEKGIPKNPLRQKAKVAISAEDNARVKV